MARVAAAPSKSTKPSRKVAKAPTGMLNPGRGQGVLSLAEVEAIRASFAALRSERGVEKALGIPRNTIRRYLHHGDPRRGIRPLLEGMPPAQGAAPPAPDPVPVVPAELHAPVQAPSGVPADDGAAPAPPPPVQVPAPAPAPQQPAAAPAAPVQPPVVPGIGAPLPAAPAAPAKPGDSVASVQHTVNVANNELVRISRNTRALYDLRQRTLTRMVSDASSRAKAGESVRLTRGEREMLMLLREARVRPVEMLALHRVEVGILGVGEGKGAVDNIDPTDETRSIEDLQAELRGLLDDCKNMLGDDDDPALASSRGPLRPTGSEVE